MAETARRGLGMPTLPLVIVSHPIGGLKMDEVLNKADDIIDEIVPALTKSSEKKTPVSAARSGKS